jgi:hypothetical protein
LNRYDVAPTLQSLEAALEADAAADAAKAAAEAEDEDEDGGDISTDDVNDAVDVDAAAAVAAALGGTAVNGGDITAIGAGAGAQATSGERAAQQRGGATTTSPSVWAKAGMVPSSSSPPTSAVPPGQLPFASPKTKTPARGKGRKGKRPATPLGGAVQVENPVVTHSLKPPGFNP